MRLYHNPRCSKSRQALALLNENGIDFEEYRYLDNGIHEDDLSILVELEGIIRISDLSNDMKLDLSKKSDLLKALKSQPRALQRPVLVRDGKAVIGRPPQNILTLLPEV